MSKKEKKGYEIEQSVSDMMRGLEMSHDKLKEGLEEQMVGLTKGELSRALSAVINYPNTTTVFHPREEKFIKDLVAMRGVSLNLEMLSIGQLQAETEAIRQKAEAEENENAES